jgi:hypothetical protein
MKPPTLTTGMVRDFLKIFESRRLNPSREGANRRNR